MEFNILTKKQVDNMQVFKDYGKRAKITDYAIALEGREVNKYGYYYLQKPLIKLFNDKYINSYINDMGDYEYTTVLFSEHIGIRPVVSYYELLNDDNVNITNGKIIYGEYPQTKVDYELKKKLDFAIKGRDIFSTGKIYTSQTGYYATPHEHPEFRYNGEKYAQVRLDWFKVEPVSWLVDMETKLAVSEKILVAGVQYDNKGDLINNYKKTEIKKFLDKYFSKELYISGVSIEEIEQSEYNRLKCLKDIKYDITDKLLKLELLEVKIKTEIFLNKTALSFDLQETLDTIKLKEKELEDKIKEIDMKIEDCTNENIVDAKILTKRIS